MTGVHKKTIMKLLVEVGRKCEQMMDERMRRIRCEAVECDEIWTFVGKKEGVMKADERDANPELGNQYTYIALIRKPKMIPAFHVGKRDSINTHQFIEDLSRRIEGLLPTRSVRMRGCPIVRPLLDTLATGRPMPRSPNCTRQRILALAAMRRLACRTEIICKNQDCICRTLSEGPVTRSAEECSTIRHQVTPRHCQRARKLAQWINDRMPC